MFPVLQLLACDDVHLTLPACSIFWLITEGRFYLWLQGVLQCNVGVKLWWGPSFPHIHKALSNIELRMTFEFVMGCTRTLCLYGHKCYITKNSRYYSRLWSTWNCTEAHHKIGKNSSVSHIPLCSYMTCIFFLA